MRVRQKIREEEGDIVMASETFILPAGGFILGLVLGCGFGFIRHTTAAHTRIGKIDKLISSWAGMSGSLAKSIFLLVMLTFFQTACHAPFRRERHSMDFVGRCRLGICMDTCPAIPAGNTFSLIA